MIYVFSRLFDAIVSPSSLLVLCTVVGTILTLGRAKARWGRRLLSVGVAGLLGFAVLPLGQLMMRPLEERFPVPYLDHVDGVIVLGGAFSIDRSINRNMPLTNDAADRMTAFMAIAQRYPRARLVFTGGSGDPLANKTPEATIARQYFDLQGLTLSRVTFESGSRNTHENAVLSQRLVQPKPGELWLLVTSATDMPRAIGAFRAVGWPVIAMPTNYQTMHRRLVMLPGLVHGLELADWAAHEWIGLIYYHLRGWSPSLFPGPGT